MLVLTSFSSSFFFFLLLIPSYSLSSIDPFKLLVVTIVDPKVERIILDSKLLFRSIRLFGGSLNNSTLISYFIIEKNKPFSNLQLLQEYQEMGVIIDFIERISLPFPGTMNKFSTFFKFDIKFYDFFLWLDADIVIFEDPIPYFNLFYRYGKIGCIPELYNYMRRYPKLNQTNLIWNSYLSSFLLPDDINLAPSGLCNTGVLLFDSITMTQFQLTLSSHPSISQILKSYKSDRFLDSLYFVSVVNLAMIEVIPMDYSLNYMAFLEVYIMDLNLTNYLPIIAHFIANSTLDCFIDQLQHNECSCRYFNDEIIPNNSKIIHRITNLLLPSSNCHIIAGIHPTPNINLLSKIKNNSLKTNTSNNISSNTKTNISTTSTTLTLTELIIPIMNRNIFYEFNKISFYFIATQSSSSSSPSPLKLSCNESFEVIIQDITSTKVMYSQLFHQENSTWCQNYNYIIQPIKFTIPIELISQNGINQIQIIFLNRIISANIICMTLLSNGIKTFNHNFLISQTPISLQSQLLLSEYLNTKKLTKTGLVFCCETWEGFVTVELLIQLWGEQLIAPSNNHFQNTLNHPILIIIVREIPKYSLNKNINIESISQLINYFSMICQETPNHLSGCVILEELNFELFSNNQYLYVNPFGFDNSTLLTTFYRHNIFSFIYIDTSNNDLMNLNQLFRLYDSLETGGILIGSRYATQSTLNKIYKTSNNNDNNSNKLTADYFITLARKLTILENFSYLNKNVILLTYSESDYWSDMNYPQGVSSLSTILPAWYFIKHS